MPKRTDDNHSAIIKGLRAVGATVRSTAMVGQGFPDIAVGHRGHNFFFEIKDGSKRPSQKRLTPAELEFHCTWQGQVRVIESLDDALQALGLT